MSVHQREYGRTLHFAPTPGRPGGELPLTAIVDRNGNQIRLEYDPVSGAPTDVLHDGGYHIGVTTDQSRVTKLTLLSDPEQRLLVRYGYDAAGNLAEIVNSSGLPLQFTYDEQSRLIRWEDRNGTWYRYDYDADGRCVLSTGTDRALEYRYAYDPEHHRTTSTNALDHTTTYQFNDCFQLVAETDPLGSTTHRELDRYDRLLAVTDPLGRSTRYEYDDTGQVLVTARPDGTSIRIVYNEQGFPSEVTDPDGATWQQAFDTHGNRVAVLDPAGNRTRFSYDDHGGIATYTDPLGNTTRIRCDAAGLPVAITDALGETTLFRRDSFGRPREITDPLGARTRVDWSVEGKPLRRLNPAGAVESWEWDPEGNLLTYTDAAGGVTSHTYGPFDLPASQTGPDGNCLTLTRDPELNLLRVTNSQGLHWEYAYDPAGRLVGETDFDGRRLVYEHDAAGQLTARINALGQPIRFERDALGRITRKDADGQITEFEYGAMGHLMRARGPDADLVFERDRFGRVTRESVNGQSLTHAYDSAGRRTQRRTPAGVLTTWTYDEAGRPAELISDGRALTFEHDAAGRETARHYGEALTLTQAWDPVGRLIAQSLGRPETTTAIAQHSYTYRADNYLTSVEKHLTGISAFTLDKAGRVTTLHSAGWTETYAYDEAGNQTHAMWPAEQPDEEAVGARTFSGSRITRAGAIRYEYDTGGRVTLRQKTRLSRKPDIWRYTWDAEDRLTGVTTPDGTQWRYLYDPLGRRIAKRRLAEDGSAIAEQVSFTWDGDTLVEQTSTSPDQPRFVSLTWNHHGLHPITQTERTADIAGQDEIDRRFYAIVTDLVGTPTHLVSESGDIVWEADATLWGAPRPGRPRSGAGAHTPLRFPGQYADAETGWHYNHHRHYDPELGRYTSPDPLGLGPAPNHYAYVVNPHIWIDPLGLAAYIHTSVSYQDWGTKGAHVHIGNREVRVFPDHNGGIAGEGIRLRTGTASDRDVQRVLDEIRSNPDFRADLINKATSARDAMNRGDFGMSSNRALEIHFLIKALEKM
ncbi:RHS repeat-associated core domain-containing protein [Streptomyces zhaozhouensis]|uniref:RHS repeat-associated core domain-containing protein n=2 Tax=Streptomyces zhaozhouensis TaxID=1300267 RepID=A0A286E8B7_9ACTN|nr:RHS repeat-associated core domain-containing protein [Streptomyces zhaozhouensis]